MSGTPKHYSPREERLSAGTHLVGAALFIVGGFPLLRLALRDGGKPFIAGVAFYWLSLAAMFGASSFYHLCRDENRKKSARKFDHCAIYLLITGTYAPLITGAIPTAAGYSVLAALTALTGIGIVGKCLFDDRFHRVEVLIYILMGWACIFIAGELFAGLPRNGLLLLFCGGIAYTGGVIFYISRREFAHALWHLCVLAGAAFQYGAILTIAMQR